MNKKPGRSTPGQRLAAANPAKVVVVEKPARLKIRTKFIVTDKTEVPQVIGGALVTLFHVKLSPVFEGRPIHSGLAYVQGNADNRIFGEGEPEAELSMKITSKAIADTLLSGRAFHLDLTEVDPLQDI